MMKYLILGFLNLVNAQDSSQSYPDNYVPPNLGEIKKIIDVSFTHNLPNSFNMREEDDYSWEYFDQGMVPKLFYIGQCSMSISLKSFEPNKNSMAMVCKITKII